MFPTKSPRPDGFHPFFSQNYWHVVGLDVMESILSFLNGESSGLNHGVRASLYGPLVTHLFFADDSLIFAKGNLQEAAAIKSLIEDYGVASSQLINFDKSSIMFHPNSS